MINKSLIAFNRNINLQNNVDLGEKVGNIGLGLLRIGFGKTLTVKKISDGANKITFTEKVYSTSAKVAAVALFIFALPVTILLAGIGYIGMACSKSHGQIFNSYNQSKQIPIDEVKKSRETDQEMPGVVLKNSGRKEAITRFHQMQEVRSILDSQNSSHLIIPKANLCQESLVEERLPINVDSYHNMELYLSQPELFDEAVRELTRLFSRVYLSNLVSHHYNPLGHIDDVGDFVRYDNLPMYVVEENGKKEGKIGLIDLEHVQNGPNSQSLETLVRIFPLHLDVIKNEASKLKMEVNEVSLDASAKKGRKCLQVGFIDHLKWLKQKGVPTEIPPQPFQVSPQRVKELTSLLETELLRLNQGVNDLFARKKYREEPKKNFFTENPQKIAEELAASITPLIIRNIETQIEKQQNKKLNKLLGLAMTESELVSLRSPIIKRPKLHEGVDKLILKNEKIKFEKNLFNEEREIAEQLAYVIMEELVKSGEIFYFDPAYYSGGHQICWIRY